MTRWPARRSIESHEQMDAPAVDDGALRRALRFIEWINRFLGYTRVTIGHLAGFILACPSADPIIILDVATGSADVPKAILKWAESHGRDVHVTALDWHPATVAVAAEARSKKLSVVRGDALALPFADDAFDFVMTSMFLHHLPDDAVVTALRELDRVARRGVIVADLLRRRRAAFWIRLFTLFSEPMIRHDARVSVRQAFTPGEIKSLAAKAGLSYTRYHAHAGHRFVLAGKKPQEGK